MRIFALVCLLALSGCQSAPVSVALPVAHSQPSAPVVEAQEGKDTVVLAEASAIDQIAPQAKEHTDAQRAAVAASPAADVKRILAEKDAEIKALRRQIDDLLAIVAKLKEAIAKAEDKFSATLRWFLTGGGSLIMALGVACFFLMSQITAVFPNLGPRIFAAIIGFGATLFATGIAYAWAANHQTIVGISLGVCALAALVYWHANRIHASTTPKP